MSNMVVVKKFGGTSVGTVERLHIAAQKVYDAWQQGQKIVVVVSAMSGVTNQLASSCFEMMHMASTESFAEYDVALSSGEIVSAALFALALQNLGLKARSIQAWQLPVRAEGVHGNDRIESIDSDKLYDLLSQDVIPVITGFQGVSNMGRITTLGRGGSDTTAVAVAVAVNADLCEIYTDVDGVYSADPRMVTNARKIDVLTYDEMLIFALCGAKVLHPRSVHLAMKFDMPIKVLSSFSDNSVGSIITKKNGDKMEKPKVTGVSYDRNLALVYAQDKSIIQKLCAENIELSNLFLNDNMVYFTVPLLDSNKNLLKNLEINKNIAVVSVVASCLNNLLINQIFDILSGERILHILTSEIKVSVIIHMEDLEKIVNKLHQLI